MNIKDLFESVFKKRALPLDEILRQVQALLPSGDATVEPRLANLYVDDDSAIFALITNQGKLFRSLIKVKSGQVEMGPQEEVHQEYQYTTGSSMTVRKQADGKYRWFAMPACVSVINRRGEIDSTILFDNFISLIQRYGVYPFLTFFHVGREINLGPADWVARDGNLLLMSGTFNDDAIAEAILHSIEKNPKYWGLSIGYFPLSKPRKLALEAGIEIPVYESGILVEVSILPEQRAASILTSFQVEENQDMKPDLIEELTKLVDGNTEMVKQLTLKVDGLNVKIKEEEMVTREADPAPADPAPETTPEETVTRADPVAVADTPVAEQAAPAGPSEEEIKAIVSAVLADQSFITAISNMISDQIDQAGATPQEDALEDEQVTKLIDMVKGLNASLVKLEERLDSLDDTEDESEEDEDSDDPVTYRPRQRQTGDATYAEKAQAVLDKMPKAKSAK